MQNKIQKFLCMTLMLVASEVWSATFRISTSYGSDNVYITGTKVADLKVALFQLRDWPKGTNGYMTTVDSLRVLHDETPLNSDVQYHFIRIYTQNELVQRGLLELITHCGAVQFRRRETSLRGPNNGINTLKGQIDDLPEYNRLERAILHLLPCFIRSLVRPTAVRKWNLQGALESANQRYQPHFSFLVNILGEFVNQITQPPTQLRFRYVPFSAVRHKPDLDSLHLQADYLDNFTAYELEIRDENDKVICVLSHTPNTQIDIFIVTATAERFRIMECSAQDNFYYPILRKYITATIDQVRSSR